MPFLSQCNSPCAVSNAICGSAPSIAPAYPPPAPAACCLSCDPLPLRTGLLLPLPPAPQAHPAPVPPLGPSVPFGKIFTQHFFVVDWDSQCGWGAPRIEPVRPFALHPAAQTLQYGSHCFEGMKAYRSRTTGRPSLFRPHLNMERFHRSAERLYLPQFDPAELLACIQKLVAVEHAWVPTEPDCSLYLRPTLMATTPYLGVGPADDCSLFVLASPCGPFLPPNDTAPVRFFLEEVRCRRCWSGAPEVSPSEDLSAIGATPQQGSACLQ